MGYKEYKDYMNQKYAEKQNSNNYEMEYQDEVQTLIDCAKKSLMYSGFANTKRAEWIKVGDSRVKMTVDEIQKYYSDQINTIMSSLPESMLAKVMDGIEDNIRLQQEIVEKDPTNADLAQFEIDACQDLKTKYQEFNHEQNPEK